MTFLALLSGLGLEVDANFMMENHSQEKENIYLPSSHSSPLLP